MNDPANEVKAEPTSAPTIELSEQERAFLERRVRTNNAGWAERLHRFVKNPPLFYICWWW